MSAEKKILSVIAVVVGLNVFAVAGEAGKFVRTLSPDGKNEIRLWTQNGLSYGVYREGRELIPRSTISLTLVGRGKFGADARLKSAERRTLSGSRQTPYGKQAKLDLAANETLLTFESDWSVRAVARNDGVAYRFETAFDGLVKVADEQVEIALPANGAVAYVNYAEGGWKAGHDVEQSSWESLTQVEAVGEIATTTNSLVYLPMVFKYVDGTALSITESDLHDYAGCFFERDASSIGNPLKSRFSRFPTKTINANWKETDDSVKHPLRCKRVIRRADYIVETTGTRTYPWRVFQIAPRAIDLCASQIVDALATSAQGDFSWVKPGQVAWDWWNAFDNKDTQDGCTTEGYRRFVDFAAKHGVPYVIMDEGWSKSLDIWTYSPTVDVPEIIRYANERGVGIVLWMAVGQVYGQEAKVAEHFGKLGAKGFKIDFMDREDADIIRFEESFAKICAQHHLIVTYHGMSKPTGLHMTYPNVLNYEGVHGLENMKRFRHRNYDFMLNDLMQVYVRMSAGQLDYTPGAMDNYPIGAYHGDHVNPGSIGTRCHQMALMSIFYAPLQMLCDSPTKYEKNLESFEFMSQVPVVWDETVGIAGDPTSFAVIARRKGSDWWCAGIASKEGKPYCLDTRFLGEGEWGATIFRDANDSAINASHYIKETRTVRAGDILRLDMSCGGGFAVRFLKTQQ